MMSLEMLFYNRNKPLFFVIIYETALTDKLMIARLIHQNNKQPLMKTVQLEKPKACNIPCFDAFKNVPPELLN